MGAGRGGGWARVFFRYMGAFCNFFAIWRPFSPCEGLFPTFSSCGGPFSFLRGPPYENFCGRPCPPPMKRSPMYVTAHWPDTDLDHTFSRTMVETWLILIAFTVHMISIIVSIVKIFLESTFKCL